LISISPLDPRPPLFPYTTLFRSDDNPRLGLDLNGSRWTCGVNHLDVPRCTFQRRSQLRGECFQRPSSRGTRHFESIERHSIVLRSEEHTSELQSRGQLVCRLLLE